MLQVLRISISLVAESKSATFDGSFWRFCIHPSYLFKGGRGTLILNATNTFTGFVNIANGILSISSLSNLASASAIKFEEKPGETRKMLELVTNESGDIDFPSGVGLSIYGSLPETIKINVNNGNLY